MSVINITISFSRLYASLVGRLTTQPRRRSSVNMHWSFDCLKTSAEMLEQVKSDIQKSAFDAATAHLAMARAGLGDDKAVLIASAELAQAQGHWPKAQARWKRVIDEHPETVMAHMHQAICIQAQGNFQQAAELYHQVMKDFPDAVGAPISIVNLLEELDKPQRQIYARIADNGLVSLTKIYPNYPILFMTRARLSKERNDLEDAHAHVLRAYEIDKNDSRIWHELRNILEVIDRQRTRTEPIFKH